MTPALEKKMEELAQQCAVDEWNNPMGSSAIRSIYRKAWFDALQALKDLAPEFSAMECDKEYLKRDENDRAWSERNGFMEGAIWAHDQLKAKLALAESRLKTIEAGDSLVIYHPEHPEPAESFVAEFNTQRVRIAALEAEAKRYREVIESLASVEDRWLTYPSKFIEYRNKSRQALTGPNPGEGEK